jgi:hypothetical protein
MRHGVRSDLAGRQLGKLRWVKSIGDDALDDVLAQLG